MSDIFESLSIFALVIILIIIGVLFVTSKAIYVGNSVKINKNSKSYYVAGTRTCQYFTGISIVKRTKYSQNIAEFDQFLCPRIIDIDSK